jgi:hypothetical protein
VPACSGILFCQIMQQCARTSRDIILQKSSNVPARRGILFCKIMQQCARMTRDIILQKSSNVPACRGILFCQIMQQCARMPRDIITPNYADQWARAPRRAAMGPRAAERLSTFDRRHINLLKFEYLIT